MACHLFNVKLLPEPMCENVPAKCQQFCPGLNVLLKISSNFIGDAAFLRDRMSMYFKI